MDEEHREFDPAPSEGHADTDLPQASSEMPGSETVEPTPAAATTAGGVETTSSEVQAGELAGSAVGDAPSEEGATLGPDEVLPSQAPQAAPGEMLAGEGGGPGREVELAGAAGAPLESGPAEAAPSEAGPTQDERTIAALAHASMLLNLVTGFGGLIAAALIWLVYRDRSKYVEDQALQATVFQGLWLVSWAAIGLMWVVVALLTAVVIGLCLIPFALVLTFVPLAAFFYPLYASVETYQGRDFKYRWIGDLVRGNK